MCNACKAFPHYATQLGGSVQAPLTLILYRDRRGVARLRKASRSEVLQAEGDRVARYEGGIIYPRVDG